MEKINRIKYIMAAMLALFVFALTTILTDGVGGNAYAASNEYSSVIIDLTKDSKFNFMDYPEDKNDYSLQVIQIAESENGYLYLYTYQPCQNTRKLTATDINMSLSETADGTKLYELIQANSWGVFVKYIVKDVRVSDSQIRYYNISSIYRAWDKTIDGETGNNNTGEKKAFSVHNVYKVTTENGEKKYSCEPTYVVNILNPYSDYLIYTDYRGLPAIPSVTHSFEKMGFIDAHYIAFSTDWEIDKLKCATVTYSYCSGTGYFDEWLGFINGSSDLTYGTPQSGYAYPTYEDKVERTGNFLSNGAKYSYTWDRIQTAAEFLATEKNLTEETKTNLADKQWVLRFLETKRTQEETKIVIYKKYKTTFTKVNKVSVLRLEFESDGITYNLGTVCDTVSGDEPPGNTPIVEKPKSRLDKIIEFFEKLINFFVNIWNKIKNLSWQHLLLIGIAIVVVICLIIAVIKFGIKAIFKLILWLISLPFRLIAKLFKRKE